MSAVNQSFWWRLSISLPVVLEESCIWKLTELGIFRFAIRSSPACIDKVSLVVWLPEFEWKERPQREFLTATLEDLGKPFACNLGGCQWELISDEDWSSTWKRYWQPDPVGKRLLVLPAWLEVPKTYSDRLILRIDPGSAFGTGSHPTTRLCLEGLEDIHPVGLRVADLGCGSGILSLAAIHLGAKRVHSVDTDPLAIRATNHNAQLNAFKEKVHASLGSIEVLEAKLEGRRADLLLCNILAPVIKDLAPKFQRILTLEGHALLSGLLVKEVPFVKSHLEKLGWDILSMQTQDAWGLLHIKRGGKTIQ